MQAEFELGDDAEVAAPASDRPEQIGVLIRGRQLDPPVGGYHLGRHQVVEAQPGLARQPSHAAAEREPGDTGVTDMAGGHREAVRLRRRVEIGQQRAPARPRMFRLRVYADLIELAEVDHQAVIGDRLARRAVCAAAHSDLQAGSRGERDRRGHVGHRRAPGDHRRAPVDVGVPHAAGLVVPRIRRPDHRPAHRRSQAVNGPAHRVCHEPSPWSWYICPCQGAGLAGAAHGCCAPILMPTVSAAGPAGRAPPGRRRRS
jgi:hypothetical protein